MGSLEGFLGCLRAVLGASWAVLKQSWGAFRAVLDAAKAEEMKMLKMHAVLRD